MKRMSATETLMLIEKLGCAYICHNYILKRAIWRKLKRHGINREYIKKICKEMGYNVL